MVIPSTSRKEQVMKLIEQRDKIERTINENGAILRANGNAGMTEPLVDEFGFPRNDIDVYQVRQARHQIICLQNDLKALMKEIENGLIAVHAEATVNSDASTKMSRMEISPATSEDDIKREDPKNIFAKVTFISSGSPAEECGLRESDEIFEFGSINLSNFKDLTQIAEVVKHRQNQQVALRIKRNNRLLELTLIPKAWSGRGLLGCNIVLADSVER